MIRSKQPTAEGRFWEKVQKTDKCWIWIAAIGKEGYGRFAVTREKIRLAHRFSYELAKGPVPVGLDLDHLCRVKRCVNPEHLEAVTRTENARRGLKGVLSTHCYRGHEYTGELDSRGWRRCRACVRERYHRLKEKAACAV